MICRSMDDKQASRRDKKDNAIKPSPGCIVAHCGSVRGGAFMLKVRYLDEWVQMMSESRRNPPIELEDLPNIGKSIATDLRNIGILSPDQLASHEPVALYHALSMAMGHRKDPCVLYTLMATKHFLECGEALPWWDFTAEGKNLLKSG